MRLPFSMQILSLVLFWVFSVSSSVRKPLLWRHPERPPASDVDTASWEIRTADPRGSVIAWMSDWVKLCNVAIPSAPRTVTVDHGAICDLVASHWISFSLDKTGTPWTLEYALKWKKDKNEQFVWQYWNICIYVCIVLYMEKITFWLCCCEWHILYVLHMFI